jgi:hypothetical protein
MKNDGWVRCWKCHKKIMRCTKGFESEYEITCTHSSCKTMNKVFSAGATSRVYNDNAQPPINLILT